jgi:uncharacterized membrane protein
LTFAGGAAPYLDLMRRTLATLVVLAALTAAGCGADDEQAASPSPQASLADLTVSVDPDGSGAEKPRTADVTCAEPGDSKVCGAVADLTADSFAPTASDVACTQQYGGPETATVTGTLRGEKVDAHFSRENGCEIARWEDAAELLGAAG